MIKIDDNGIEFEGNTPDIEAQTISIMIAWIIQLDKYYDISHVLSYIKEIANLSVGIVNYIKQGKSVDDACVRATADMLKELENGIQR